MTRERQLAKTPGHEIEITDPWNTFRDMERMFRNFFTSPVTPWRSPKLWVEEMEITPEVDICENEKELVLSATVPGINKNDIDIDVTEDSITLSGERKTLEEKPGETYHVRQQSYGKFRVSYALPVYIKPGEVAATYKDGILEITMPKAEVTQAHKVKVELK